MNTFGAILMVASGATVLFSIVNALLGLSLRTERNLIRFLSLELIDRWRGRTGRTALAPRAARGLLSVWRPAKLTVVRLVGYRSQGTALAMSRQALYVNFALVSLAFITLMSLMAITDLSNVYVARNSSVDLPAFFRVTGAWAGSSGSLLFWYFLLTLFTSAVLWQTRDKLHNRLPLLFLILGLLNFLFILLSLFFDDAQPFREHFTPMKAGRGLNPLLLHWAMIIHPPVLYVGYVSFAVPFAIALSAVISRNLREDWLQLIRRWSVFSWFFLGTGILLGSKWAYEELGWGGYWAWDPVENASLMPFLLATAFLHSLIVQERRGMLRFWNVLLITLAYHFCLIGTWITRSGILEGPHTFSKSTIGKPFIIYILVSLVFFLRYLYFMRKQLRPARKLEAVTSKEGSMLLNNFLMAMATAIILVGVFSPLLPLDCSFTSAGLTCHKVEWKQSTYNKLMVPLGIFTLFLMGASPLLAWRKSADTIYARNLRIPIITGIIGCVAFGVLYQFLFTGAGGADESAWGPGVVAEWFSILTVGVSVFVISGLALEYYRAVRSRRLRFGENVVLALIRTVLRNKRRYAGYLVHLSIVFLCIGYAGNAFKKTEKFTFHYYRMPQHQLSPAVHYYSNDKGFLEGYEIHARDLFIRPDWKKNADKTRRVHFTVSQEAHFNITRSSSGKFRRNIEVRPANLTPLQFAHRPVSFTARLLKLSSGIILDGRMRTERQFHPQINPRTGGVLRDRRGVARRTPTSEPDIRSTWNEDIYIQLGAIADAQTGRNPDFSHIYEYFYFNMNRHPIAYQRFFPATITATLEVWINPLVKFIWLGSILFFLSGLVILIPFGERDL